MKNSVLALEGVLCFYCLLVSVLGNFYFLGSAYLYLESDGGVWVVVLGVVWGWLGGVRCGVGVGWGRC